MKLRLLFFYLISITCVINSSPLIDTPKRIDGGTHTSMVLLLAGICNFLEQGYTVDEIATFINKYGYAYDEIEKVVLSVNHILNYEASTRRISNNIVDNEQSEKFYAQKSTKAIVATVIAIIACIGLFQYFKEITDWLKRFFRGAPIIQLGQSMPTDINNSNQPTDPEEQSPNLVEPNDTQTNQPTEQLQSSDQTSLANTEQNRPAIHSTSNNKRGFVFYTMIDEPMLKKFRERMKNYHKTLEGMEHATT
jgi:hypothetical protein